MAVTNVPLRTYLACVVAAGFAALVASLVQLAYTPVGAPWLVLAALTMITGWARLRMPGSPVTFSISDTFTMTAAMLYGPAAGAALVALDGLVISSRLKKDRNWPLWTVFNATAPALAMWLAASLFFAVGGFAPFAQTLPALGYLPIPLALFGATYYLLNTGVVAVAVALQHKKPIETVWREHFASLWPTYFGGASIAGMLVYLVPVLRPDIQTMMLVLPLLVILYVTFRTAIERVHERVGHLAEVNRSYLAVINALAQAIDAKDQITHGHIRRVQQYTVRLAKALGVTSEREIQALEAGALLHDVGKLAIPEHILNKPAKLTDAEFERMKSHAEIGAQILSSIDFPYPVVPIVRHHHERWDGRGYPSGLAGEEIPIGARILSVVDCFDALRSDRPYRNRMADDEIVSILRSRAGTMYDPNVVERFLATLNEILEDDEQVAAVPPHALEMAHDAPSVDVDEAAVEPRVPAFTTLIELGGQLARGDQDLPAKCAVVQNRLSRIMPAAACVIFGPDAQTDRLVPHAVAGAHADALSSLRFLNGERLSGWVAAHLTPIVNSPAVLDLGDELMATLQPPFTKCVSVAITGGNDQLAALTVYSTGPADFTPEDAEVIQAVANELAQSPIDKH